MVVSALLNGPVAAFIQVVKGLLEHPATLFMDLA